MGPRAASPALSENEFDISKDLYDQSEDDANDSDSILPPPASAKAQKPQAGEQELGLNDIGEDSSDDEAYIAARQAASNRKTTNLKGRSVKKSGGFQAMGLNSHLLKAITRKGFSVPTPIQRKAIPVIMDGQDVVGMARTGSGKTAAFVIPMVEKLKAHSVKVGARGIVMSPSRELALQTLKVIKELGRGTDLRTVLLVGGDSLEEQFGSMTSNPDIIIATPGRFLHLKVEMGLDLSAVQYIVFDEADRLFEMGFAAQLAEILHALPQSRQSLLFSATLPKSLVEFARAGLQDPKLIRLDAETKLSPDLQSAFFTLKSADKDGALLNVLQDVIKMPLGATENAQRTRDQSSGKKRKRGPDGPAPNELPTEFSTIIFTATKHHVEYVSALLRSAGYAISYVYGSLDQTARKLQVEEFRAGLSNILVVTDVAARGIDMPILANVINYDFPPQPKVFVHRVGRTARAGNKGWSYSLVRDSDMPYLLDLQLFLSKRLVLGRSGEPPNFAQDVVVGGLVRDKLGKACEYVNKLIDEDDDLANLRSVAVKGEKLYMRTRNSASSESAKRSREILSSRSSAELNWLFTDETNDAELEREKMLARVSGFRPSETIFEIGKRGSGAEAAEIMRKRRERIDPWRQRAKDIDGANAIPDITKFDTAKDTTDGNNDVNPEAIEQLDPDSEDELQITVTQTQPSSSVANNAWEDPDHFMSYAPKSLNLVEDKAYGVQSGSYDTSGRNSNFVEASRGATMDLNNDESRGFAEATKARGMRWDKKSKKYVARANDEDGSKGAKMIVGESGQKIAASFRSGRFDAWKKSNKLDRLPRTGETETSRAKMHSIGRRYKHQTEKAPKEADKYRDDYHTQKKRVNEAKEKRIGKFKDGGAKNELRGVDDVRKDRKLKAKKQEKFGRPAKKRKT
ncbi:ATP-dependent RNA helicase dbp10 [Pseudovirgaria hyperparasitica]|uniref:RNA helicase n=1 Tax=Pseudovirgaria hyperparasitica TaxID=470096 RepID=A0A6A6WH27_9PEZI|nr:ATP-dependent RNA helicase dbp10 [Pseudovirgaria hyperparasitica]KAF2761519.1 ATP-dependent RNA helicase dbp10 [Pseudovirgaria hyperparasitica]